MKIMKTIIATITIAVLALALQAQPLHISPDRVNDLAKPHLEQAIDAYDHMDEISGLRHLTSAVVYDSENRTLVREWSRRLIEDHQETHQLEDGYEILISIPHDWARNLSINVSNEIVRDRPQPSSEILMHMSARNTNANRLMVRPGSTDEDETVSNRSSATVWVNFNPVDNGPPIYHTRRCPENHRHKTYIQMSAGEAISRGYEECGWSARY